MEDFVYILVICETTSVRSIEGFKISARVRQCSVTSNTLWASVNFFGQITVQRYVVFVSIVELRTLYIQELPYMNKFVNAPWKNRTYACTFPVQRRAINVVKVRFTMRYSSRKLSNDKVITTACNFWRKIACSFQVTSGNILFLGNKIFEIPPFFQTRPGDLGKKVHACSLRFSALNDDSNPFTQRQNSLNFQNFIFLSNAEKLIAPDERFAKENRPFYWYGGHIELIRFKKYYRMPRGHEHDPIYRSLRIYARFSGQFFSKLS